MSGNLLQNELKDETGEGKPRFITFNDWRFFTFVDGGYARDSRTRWSSSRSTFGAGATASARVSRPSNYLNGMVAFSVPSDYSSIHDGTQSARELPDLG